MVCETCADYIIKIPDLEVAWDIWYNGNHMHISEFSNNIFLDSGDPAHTADVLGQLGFLHGQTTNPSLVAKSDVIAELAQGETLSQEELMAGYRTIATRIHKQIPGGSVSLEVYADANTTAQEMIEQAHALARWIPDPHIKLPITRAGLEAASELVAQGVKVNMTLCFSQEQAMAVHYATLGAKPGQVLVSPFLGRLDDIGQCGVSLIKNIVRAYQGAESHVSVLAASIRSLGHIYACVHAGADILTIPYKLFAPWAEHNFAIPDESYVCVGEGLERIPFGEDIATDWRTINIHHELTDKGLQKFADDWNALIGKA